MLQQRPLRVTIGQRAALYHGRAAPTGTAQSAQNEPGTLELASAPRPGAPMSFADLAAKLQPAVVNVSTTQRVQVASGNPFAGTPFSEMFGGGDAPNGGRPVTIVKNVAPRL